MNKIRKICGNPFNLCHLCAALMLGFAMVPTVRAEIHRVNNNPGAAVGVRTYSDLTQAVIDGAAAGDTIFIEGSVTPYSTPVAVSKKLYIIGPGFYLSENVETQHIKYSAKVATITFAIGSEGSVLAGIEQIRTAANANNTALTVNPRTAWGTTAASVEVNDSNINIVNCRLYRVNIVNDHALKKIAIQKCWFGPGVIVNTGSEPVATLNISNNFFRNDQANTSVNAGTILLDAMVQATISNNTFFNGFKITAANSVISNNAFFWTNQAYGIITDLGTGGASNTCSYNIAKFALSGIVHGIGGNVFNAGAVTDWFACTGNNDLYDSYFLSVNGTNAPLKYVIGAYDYEMGMYGGLSPYIYSGLTRVPAVYEIVMPSEVSGDGFEVTVKVRAH